MKQICRWHILPTFDDVVERATTAIARGAERAAGDFHVVLAGGSTPKAVYRRLAGMDLGWHRWHVWYGDERCVATDHPDRNSLMAMEEWLSKVAIPPAQIHPMPAELGAVEGAARYGRMLSGVGDFDLVLLGLGEDGHTASLFPDHHWGEAADAADTLAVFGAPKPPPERVSLSAHRLARAKKVIFLVTGEGKREAVARWMQGEHIPAASVLPKAGVDVLMDRSCLCGELS